MCYLCYDKCKWVDIQIFLDKDDEPQASSRTSSLYWLAGGVKEPTHFSQRVGNVPNGVLALFPKIPKLGTPAE